MQGFLLGWVGGRGSEQEVQKCRGVHRRLVGNVPLLNKGARWPIWGGMGHRIVLGRANFNSHQLHTHKLLFTMSGDISSIKKMRRCGPWDCSSVGYTWFKKEGGG